MASSESVTDQYEREFGYYPESLQKLHNYVKEKGISMKYSAVKKAFETMKQDLRSKPKRDTVKSEITNLDVNKSKIDIDLIPTPEAEQQAEAQQTENNDDDNKVNEKKENQQENKSKKWVFDVSKATEAIEIFEKLNKKLTITAETLPEILAWANNDENKYGISLSELKQAYAQKKDFEKMDFPSNKKVKKKKKTKKKEITKQNDNDDEDVKLDLIEDKTMIEFCTNDTFKELLRIYKVRWNHEPDSTKPQQLLLFIDEQKLNEKDDKFKEINFEKIKNLFDEYNEYKKQNEIENVKIKANVVRKEKKKDLNEFVCRDVLNKYIEQHGKPNDSTMFYKYVLEQGYDIEFKQLDEELNKALGIKKKKAKKVKVKKTSKQLKALYKKAKQ